MKKKKYLKKLLVEMLREKEEKNVMWVNRWQLLKNSYNIDSIT